MIRVLIVDQHVLVREGLMRILSEAPDMKVTADASCVEDALQGNESESWDVMLLDIALPNGDGLGELSRAKSQYPSRSVLVVTACPEERLAVRAIRAGASGYLTKDQDPGSLMTAIRTIFRGKRFITPSVAELLAVDVVTHGDGEPHQALSDREFQILLLLASGKSIQGISSELSLAGTTISTYRHRILQKMGLTNNAELTRYAIENQLLS